MFDFSKFSEVGDYLSLMENEEYCRSAIGRYYYLLFGCVRRYLIEVMTEPEYMGSNDIHRKVSDRLIKSRDKTESEIGTTLDNLRQLRNKADYGWSVDSEFFKNNIGWARGESGIALEQLKSLRNSPPFEL